LLLYRLSSSILGFIRGIEVFGRGFNLLKGINISNAQESWFTNCSVALNMYIYLWRKQKINIYCTFSSERILRKCQQFCAISIEPIKRFGLSFEMIFQYSLLLCGKLYAEHCWKSLNSCILSSVMSSETFKQLLEEWQWSDGWWVALPSAYNREQKPRLFPCVVLLALGTSVCARGWFHGPQSLGRTSGCVCSYSLSSAWVLSFVAEQKSSFLVWLLKWTTSRNRELRRRLPWQCWGVCTE